MKLNNDLNGYTISDFDGMTYAQLHLLMECERINRDKGRVRCTAFCITMIIVVLVLIITVLLGSIVGG